MDIGSNLVVLWKGAPYRRVRMGAVENVKEVADLIKKFNDIDLNRRILNLENEVLDLSRDKARSLIHTWCL